MSKSDKEKQESCAREARLQKVPHFLRCHPVKVALYTACAVVLIGLFCFFAVAQPQQFFTLTLANWLTILTAVVFSFLLVQQNTDKRKLMEKLDLLVQAYRNEFSSFHNQLLKHLQDSGAATPPNEVMIAHTTLENRLDLMTRIHTSMPIQASIKEIKTVHDQYMELWSTFPCVLSAALPNFDDFLRIYKLILTKCENLCIELYL